MVMHARKPQRMNDGYFEKHQSHSYQSSKYSSKQRDYERERSSNYRDRDISPGGGGGLGSGPINNGNSYRSQSPDIDSPSSRGGGGGHGSHDIRDRGDHRGGGGGGGSGDRFSYMQKMRDRDRDVYKKDKYSDKRDRRGGGGGGGGNDRDSESYRTNHDRERRGGGGAKLCSSSGGGGGGGDKRSGSDDRDRERDRDLRDIRDKRDRASDRDRDVYKKDKYSDKRERSDRGERVARCGDWSEHVSSSGKMYYYNCKTEVSQWEKPKEWLDRERNVTRDQHREKDYRDKDRDRDRDDRFSRSAYTKHSSSRDNSRLRWNYDNDGGPPSHRRRLDGRHNDNVDMDISPGDSTPTSEASYSLSGTPTTHGGGGQMLHNNHDQTTLLSTGLANALPRLASHPNTMTNASASGVAATVHAMHFPASASVTQTMSAAGNGGGGSVNSGGGGAVVVVSGVIVGGATMLPTTGLASVPSSNVATTVGGSVGVAQTSNLRKLDANMPLTQHQTHMSVSNSSSSSLASNQMDHHHHHHHLNSNAPGPPTKMQLSAKEQQDIMLGVQHKSSLIMRQQHQQHQAQHQQQHHQQQQHHGVSVEQSHHSLLVCGVGGGGIGIGNSASTDIASNHAYNSVNSTVNATNAAVAVGGGGHSLRDNNPIHSPLYNLTHSHHSLLSSPSLNYTKSPLTTIGGGSSVVGVTNNINSGVIGATYSCNPPSSYGLKTVEGGGGINVGVNSIGSSSSLCSSSSLANIGGVGVGGHMPNDGPPTPTQELDLSGTALDQQQQQQQLQQPQQQQRKHDGTTSSAASLSTLQSCVASSVPAGRLQGPEISPKLAKYFRADLITHVTNWQADALEKQAQKCSEDTHLYGDLTTTRICTELKCARSLVRVSEINATLHLQKVMYLRQQIRRIEESKTQNSFMSDDS